MKIIEPHHPKNVLHWLTPPKLVSGTILSSKTPSPDLEDRVVLDGLKMVQFTWKLNHITIIDKNFLNWLTPLKLVAGTILSTKTPSPDLGVGVVLDGLKLVQMIWKLNLIIQITLCADWHHQKQCQEPSCPPRLHLLTWRTGGGSEMSLIQLVN